MKATHTPSVTFSNNIELVTQGSTTSARGSRRRVDPDDEMFKRHCICYCFSDAWQDQKKLHETMHKLSTRLDENVEIRVFRPNRMHDSSMTSFQDIEDQDYSDFPEQITDISIHEDINMSHEEVNTSHEEAKTSHEKENASHEEVDTPHWQPCTTPRGLVLDRLMKPGGKKIYFNPNVEDDFVSDLYNIIYEAAGFTHDRNLYSDYILMTESGQYIRPNTDFYQYLNVKKDNGRWTVKPHLNLIFLPRPRGFYEVRRMETWSCIKVLDTFSTLLIIFCFIMTAVVVACFGFAIVLSLMSSILLTKHREGVTSGAASLYVLLVFFQVVIWSFIILVTLQYIVETAKACLIKKFEIPQFSIFCPGLIKVWHSNSHLIRHIISSLIMLFVMVSILLDSNTQRRLRDKDDSYGLENQIFATKVGIVCLIFGFLFTLIYTAQTVFFDFYSFIYCYFNDMWLSRVFTWEKRLPDQRGKKRPLNFEQVFCDFRRDQCHKCVNKREPITCRTIPGYILWLMSNVQFWLVVVPLIFMLPIMTATKQKSGAIAFWMFCSWASLIVVWMRHWRRMLLQFGQQPDHKFVCIAREKQMIASVLAIVIIIGIILFVMVYSLWYWEGIANFKDSKDRRLADLAVTMENYQQGPYPVCGSSAKNYHSASPVQFSTLDSIFFAWIAYDPDPYTNLTDWYGQENVCPKGWTNCSSSQWHYISNVDFETADGVVYYHFYHPESQTDLIGIRGTRQGIDWPENFAMGGASAALKMLSNVISIDSLLSQRVIESFVKTVHPFQALMYPESWNHYLPNLLEYVRSTNATEENHFVYFAGHSMGGLLAELASAAYYEENKNTQSFSVANPGAKWLGKKYDIDYLTFKLTSTTVNAERDIIPMFSGLPGGTVFTMKCTVPFYGDCHMSDLMFCEMARSCLSYGTTEHMRNNTKRLCNNIFDIPILERSVSTCPNDSDGS